jgi:hypothetical protein
MVSRTPFVRSIVDERAFPAGILRRSAHGARPSPGIPWEIVAGKTRWTGTVEECWNHTKYADLPNFIPDDLDHLQTAVYESMLEQREDQKLMHSFFVYAKLPL